MSNPSQSKKDQLYASQYYSQSNFQGFPLDQRSDSMSSNYHHYHHHSHHPQASSFYQRTSREQRLSPLRDERPQSSETPDPRRDDYSEYGHDTHSVQSSAQGLPSHHQGPQGSSMMIKPDNQQGLIEEQQQELWRLHKHHSVPSLLSHGVPTRGLSRDQLFKYANNLGQVYRPSQAVQERGGFNILEVSPLARVPNSFTAISAALNAAQDGDRILVYPGHYIEALQIRKQVCLIALGRVELTHQFREPLTVKLEHRQQCCLVKGFSIRRELPNPIESSISQHYQSNSDQYLYATNCHCGQVIFDNCNITSSKSYSVYSTANKLTIINCRLSSSASSSILVYGKNSELILRDSVISGSSSQGVELRRTQRGAIIQGCTITHCDKSGILVYHSDKVRIAFNYIGYNGFAAVELSNCKDSEIKRNQIYFCNKSGIFVQEDSDVLIEGNDIHSNRNANILIKDRSYARVAWNLIRYSFASGVKVDVGCSIKLHHNVIKYHQTNGVECFNSNIQAQYNIIEKNRNMGVNISVHQRIQGFLACNRIIANAQAPWNSFVARNLVQTSKQVDIRQEMQNLKCNKDFFTFENIAFEQYEDVQGAHPQVLSEIKDVEERVYEKKGKATWVDSRRDLEGSARASRYSRSRSKEKYGSSRNRSESERGETVQAGLNPIQMPQGKSRIIKLPSSAVRSPSGGQDEYSAGGRRGRQNN